MSSSSNNTNTNTNTFLRSILNKEELSIYHQTKEPWTRITKKRRYNNNDTTTTTQTQQKTYPNLKRIRYFYDTSEYQSWSYQYERSQMDEVLYFTEIDDDEENVNEDEKEKETSLLGKAGDLVQCLEQPHHNNFIQDKKKEDNLSLLCEESSLPVLPFLIKEKKNKVVESPLKQDIVHSPKKVNNVNECVEVTTTTTSPPTTPPTHRFYKRPTRSVTKQIDSLLYVSSTTTGSASEKRSSSSSRRIQKRTIVTRNNNNNIDNNNFSKTTMNDSSDSGIKMKIQSQPTVVLSNNDAHKRLTRSAKKQIQLQQTNLRSTRSSIKPTVTSSSSISTPHSKPNTMLTRSATEKSSIVSSSTSKSLSTPTSHSKAITARITRSASSKSILTSSSSSDSKPNMRLTRSSTKPNVTSSSNNATPTSQHSKLTNVRLTRSATQSTASSSSSSDSKPNMRLTRSATRPVVLSSSFTSFSTSSTSDVKSNTRLTRSATQSSTVSSSSSSSSSSSTSHSKPKNMRLTRSATKQNKDVSHDGSSTESESESDTEEDEVEGEEKYLMKPKFIEKWNTRYEELVQYKKEHGHVNVPHRQGALGRWVTAQRVNYKNMIEENQDPRSNRMSPERLQALEKLGFQWTMRLDWDQSFEKLQEFYHKYGHTRVPTEVPNDGGVAKHLHVWCAEQRVQYQYKQKNKPTSITDEKIQKLKSLDFHFDVLGEAWEKKFQELVEYKKKHNGYTNVPIDSACGLGVWVHSQRSQYMLWKQNKHSCLTEDRRLALEGIGFSWSSLEAQLPQKNAYWEKKYKELIQFKEKHGHTNVSCNAGKLGRWVSVQRDQYRFFKTKTKPSNMTEERIQKLEKIGFKWKVRVVTEWEDWFQQLVQYKKKHGHTDPPGSGTNKSRLGNWVHNQRAEYRRFINKTGGSKMTQEKIKKFKSIGFNLTPVRKRKKS